MGTETDYAEHLRTDLACRDCASEVRVTVGSDYYRPYRVRVIHSDGCPWYAKHLASERGYSGAIPCSTQVVHRGPYKRDPEQPETTDTPGWRGPIGPGRQPKACRVPECGDPADLYPAGWLCDTHRPGARAAGTGGTS